MKNVEVPIEFIKRLFVVYLLNEIVFYYRMNNLESDKCHFLNTLKLIIE